MTVHNSRRTELGLSLDLASLGTSVAGDSGFVADLFRIFLPADFTHSRELSSSYDRATFETDLAYRLALGRVNKFRVQDGVPATAARDATTLLLTAGARLPLDLQVRMTYRDFYASVWQRWGDIQTQVRSSTGSGRPLRSRGPGRHRNHCRSFSTP